MHPTFLLSLLLPLAHALPSPKTAIASAPWHLTHYTATITPSNTSSTLTFTFHDTGPSNTLEITCMRTPAWSSTWTVCDGGAGNDLFYQATEEEMSVRRRLGATSSNYGIATQGTCWQRGEGGNVSETTGGAMMYAREAAWEFPVQAVVGGA